MILLVSEIVHLWRGRAETGRNSMVVRFVRRRAIIGCVGGARTPWVDEYGDIAGGRCSGCHGGNSDAEPEVDCEPAGGEIGERWSDR